MCGLAFIMRKDGVSAVKQLIKTYEKQKTRGQLGFGYLAFTKGDLEAVDRSPNEKEIYKSLKDLKSEAILFHHRLPTSTPNFKEGAHPIYVSNKRLKHDYYVIHNGVISNDDFLKEKHEKLGYEYTTEMLKTEVETWTTRDGVYSETTESKETKYNDSEALAIELVESIEANSNEVKAYGSIAFICIQTTKNDGDNVVKVEKVYYGRNTNPLKIEDNNNFFKLSSEGNGEDIKPHTLYVLNIEANVVMEAKCTFGSDYVANYKTGKWVEGEYKNGKWTAGYWKDDKDEDDDKIDVKKLGVHFAGRPDIDEYEDEEYKKRTTRRAEEIEGKLEDEGYDDIPEDYLTGEETVEELKAMLPQAKKRYDEYLAKGETENADEYWIIIAEVEEALENWAIANAGQDPQLLLG